MCEERKASGSSQPLDEHQAKVVQAGLDLVLLDLDLHKKVARTVHAADKSSTLPLNSLIRDRNLWLISLTAFGTNFGWVFLLTWFPHICWKFTRCRWPRSAG